MIHFHSLMNFSIFSMTIYGKPLNVYFSIHLNKVIDVYDIELFSETDAIQNLDRKYLRKLLTIATCELLFIFRGKLIVLLWDFHCLHYLVMNCHVILKNKIALYFMQNRRLHLCNAFSINGILKIVPAKH